MAEQDNEVQKRLKELEADLAKELDQPVKLTGVSDPRLEGSVMVNPTLGAASKPAEPAAVPEVEDADEEDDDDEDDEDLVDPTDVDSLLNSVDKGFADKLNAVQSDLSQVTMSQNLESVALDQKLFEEKDEKAQEITESKAAQTPKSAKEKAPAKSYSGIISSFFNLIAACFILPIHLGAAIASSIDILKDPKLAPPEKLKLLLPKIQAVIEEWRKKLREHIRSYRQYSKRQYLLFFLALGMALGLYMVSHDIVRNFRADLQKDPFLKSFKEVADSETEIDAEEGGEDILSPLRHPEYAVLLPRIIANLKPPSPSRSPMVALELYIEATNQDCAIEIKDRRVEIKDLIQRTLEETTFEQLENHEGKERFKIHLRLALNKILNKGRAKRVFFHSLNIHQ